MLNNPDVQQLKIGYSMIIQQTYAIIIINVEELRQHGKTLMMLNEKSDMQNCI